MRRLAALILALVVVPTLLVGCRQAPAPDNGGSSGAAAGPRAVVALGRLEPATGVIDIHGLPGARIDSLGSGLTPNSPAPDELSRFGLREGGKVQPGAVLVRLDSYNLLQTQYDAAQAKLNLSGERRKQELNVAEAQLNQAVAALAQAEAKVGEVLAQQARLDALKLAADIADEDVGLLTSIQANDDELITPQQLRRQEGQAEMTKAEYAAAEQAAPHALTAATKAVAAAQANVDLAQANFDLITALDPGVAARLELKAAQQARDQAEIRAPRATGTTTEYTVLNMSTMPGGFVTQFPVMQIADLDTMVCIAEVYEADAKEISTEQTAKITSTAFGAPFGGNDGFIRGRVVRIGKLVSTPGLTNRNPLAPSDRSVIEVRVEIDPNQEGAMEQVARLVGMQVTVEFLPTSEAAE